MPRPPPGTAVRDVEAECLRGLQIDHEFVLGRLLNRQIGRLLAFKDAIDIGRDPTEQTNQVRSIGHQSTIHDKVAVTLESGRPVSVPGVAESPFARHTLFRISRPELHRVFAEGVELMRTVQPGARVRPCAFETLDGRWLVHLVRYSALSDPLMTAPAAGSA